MRKVLIVDDSKVVRMVVRRIVESLGFAADEAADGQQALDYCRESGPPDAIILDVAMPRLDGMSCLRALRQDERFQQCLVIMCTTQHALPQIQEALAAGANEYIMKPFTDDILADKFRQVGLLP